MRTPLAQRAGLLAYAVLVLEVFVGLSCFSSATDATSPSIPLPPTSEHEPAPVPMSSIAAFELLRDDSVFASAQVGYVGGPSLQSRALRVLLSDAGRDQLLHRLWSQGTPVGRLYGLVGFALTDRSTFRREVELAYDDRTAVPTMIGCIVASSTVSDLAHLIDGEFADAFRPDSTSARFDALADSIDFARRRIQAPAF